MSECWTQSKISLAMPHGAMTSADAECFGMFGVHPVSDGWRVTHWPTGYRVLREHDFPDAAIAKHFVEALASETRFNTINVRKLRVLADVVEQALNVAGIRGSVNEAMA